MLWMTLLALTAGTTAGLVQQSTPAWRFTTLDRIGAVQLTPFGTLAVQTGDGVVVLDIATGQAAWQRRDARSFDIIEATPYGIVSTAAGLELVDFETGATRWSLRALPLDRVRSYIAMPERELMLIYGAADTSQLVVLAVSMDSGHVRWRQAGLFNAPEKLASRRQSITLADATPVLWDTDTTMVLYPSHGGPIKLDGRTGHLLWRLDTLRSRKPPARGEGYSPMLAEGARIFVPYGKSLMAVDAGTGNVLWSQEEVFDRRIAQMELTPHGLLIRGGPGERDPFPRSFLDLLDPALGDPLWEQQLERLEYPTPFLIIGDTAFLAAKGRLLGVDVRTGAVREITTLGFEGRDVPYTLEAVEHDFLVVGSQNLTLIDRRGHEVYRLYYPAVGASLLAKIASSTLILAVNVASVATANRNGGMTLITYNPVLSTRYRASQLAASFHFVFTSQKDEPNRDGFSFVRLDTRLGLERGRVWVTDRTPAYVLDPVTATLILRVDKRELHALRF